MTKLKVGFVGWRGMVGSVLIQRMTEENDFENIESFFFTTSQAGEQCIFDFSSSNSLIDANDIEYLKKMDIILTCQGSEFTEKIYPQLKSINWKGHWIDAASYLRMDPSAIIVLDPVNRKLIDSSLSRGNKTWVGGNCTVSLMLLAIHGLIKKNMVNWVSSMTYQAASGAGAKNMKELLKQMGFIYENVKSMVEEDHNSILEIDDKVSKIFFEDKFPKDNFSAPLAGSLIPWIDSDLNNGVSKEEWKGRNETLKILQNNYSPIHVDGLCVRIGTMRSHSQALTLKLNSDIDIKEINKIISSGNEWVKLVPNAREETIANLSPIKTSGTLDIMVGRVRKLNLDDNIISLFTVGDQLLWGAAEPLRRILSIIIKS